MVIDCAAVTFNYVCIQSMQKVAGVKVTFLNPDYSRLLCGSAVLYFHLVPRSTRLQSFCIICFIQHGQKVQFIQGRTMTQIIEVKQVEIHWYQEKNDIQLLNRHCLGCLHPCVK